MGVFCLKKKEGGSVIQWAWKFFRPSSLSNDWHCFSFVLLLYGNELLKNNRLFFLFCLSKFELYTVPSPSILVLACVCNQHCVYCFVFSLSCCVYYQIYYKNIYIYKSTINNKMHTRLYLVENLGRYIVCSSIVWRNSTTAPPNGTFQERNDIFFFFL